MRATSAVEWFESLSNDERAYYDNHPTMMALDALLMVEDEDTPKTDIFQPTNFAEYIGQEDIKKILQITIGAAKIENRPLPNIMLAGGFGLGKTSLAQIILREAGITPKLIDGASVNKTLPSGQIIIDEIHNVAPDACDSLNMLIDQNKVHIIGCTTNPGLLPAAFRSRFRIHTLQNYTKTQLVEILSNICFRKNVTAYAEILYLIAKRSRSNARQATTLLGQIFDSMAVEHTTYMSEKVVLEAFDLLGVDPNGYLARDKAYVKALPNDHHPVGVKWLSSVLGIDTATIEEEIEPYLLQTGIIDRTPRGRVKIRDI